MIPQWLSWVLVISYGRLEYAVLASLAFSGTVTDISTLGIGNPSVPSNIILEHQIDVPVFYYPGPVFYHFAHFLVYAAVSLALLQFVSPKQKVMGRKQGGVEYLVKSVTGLVINWQAVDEWFSKKKTKSCGNSSSHEPENDENGKCNDESTTSTAKDTTHRVDIVGQRLPPCQPVTIHVQNLSIAFDTKPPRLLADPPNHQRSLLGFKSFVERVTRRNRVQKKILHDVGFVIPSGELTAIMGESGSGKTTLLDAILKRSPSNFSITGNVWFNGSKNPLLNHINTLCGYVRQNEGFLLENLTVRETFRFSADLSLGPAVPQQERWNKVEEIIDVMGLRECADVLVGGSEVIGCSGGQKRRVSIGIQLIFEPTCLFLDEPTTGLDSMT
ncbi:ATP-binding cassette sub- G member 5, partial [Lunasporangiospora selenospora]